MSEAACKVIIDQNAETEGLVSCFTGTTLIVDPGMEFAKKVERANVRYRKAMGSLLEELREQIPGAT